MLCNGNSQSLWLQTWLYEESEHWDVEHFKTLDTAIRRLWGGLWYTLTYIDGHIVNKVGIPPRLIEYERPE